MRTLDYHAPIERKILPANENYFISKALRKTIRLRSRMKKLYLKNKAEINQSNNKKEMDYCANLLGKT